MLLLERGRKVQINNMLSAIVSHLRLTGEHEKELVLEPKWKLVDFMGVLK